jgi:DNA-binding transcriptional LysR family regulator
MLVVLPQCHRFAKRDVIRLADLSDEDFIVYPNGMVLRDLVLRLTQTAGFVARIGQETPHISSILELVAAGLGVSLLPESAFSMAPADVRFVLCDAAETADVALVWRKQESSEAVKQFVDTALSVNPPVTATARPSQTAAAAHVDSSSTDRHNRG